MSWKFSAADPAQVVAGEARELHGYFEFVQSSSGEFAAQFLEFRTVSDSEEVLRRGPYRFPMPLPYALAAIRRRSSLARAEFP